MTTNPREAAVIALYKTEKEGEYSNRALLSAVKDLLGCDTALATEMVMGVLRNKIYLDFIIRSYSKIRLKKLSDYVLQILRCGVYQLVKMDKIPPSAACNEAVKLAKKYAHSAAGGYVNGVMRTVSRNIDNLPKPKGAAAEVMSIKYSCPLWLVEKLISQLGIETTEDILSDSIKPHPTMIRVNSLKTTADELLEVLKTERINAVKDTETENCLRVSGAIDINKSNAYKGGFYTLQNINSIRAAALVNPKSGYTVMDLCAAPGGKTTYLAEMMGNKGKIYAFDLHKHKIDLINNTAKRLGIDIIKAENKDTSKLMEEFSGIADCVLADVPCSGIGVIHKKPDIKYNRTEGDIEELVKIQKNILNAAAVYVKSGGSIVYSTCTILEEENQNQIKDFLEKHKDFKKEYEETYYAHKTGGSGFYVCRLVKEI